MLRDKCFIKIDADIDLMEVSKRIFITMVIVVRKHNDFCFLLLNLNLNYK